MAVREVQEEKDAAEKEFKKEMAEKDKELEEL